MGASQSELECAICTNMASEDSELRELPCSHCVCAECLSKLLDSAEQKLKCPFCRQEFSDMTEQSLLQLPTKKAKSVGFIEKLESLFHSSSDSHSEARSTLESNANANSNVVQHDAADDLFELSSFSDSADELRDSENFAAADSARWAVWYQRRQAAFGSGSLEAEPQPQPVRGRPAQAQPQPQRPHSTRHAYAEPKARKSAGPSERRPSVSQAQSHKPATSVPPLKQRGRKSNGRRSQSKQTEEENHNWTLEERDLARREAEQRIRVQCYVERLNASPRTKERTARFFLSIQNATAQ